MYSVRPPKTRFCALRVSLAKSKKTPDKAGRTLRRMNHSVGLSHLMSGHLQDQLKVGMLLGMALDNLFDYALLLHLSNSFIKALNHIGRYLALIKLQEYSLATRINL